MSHLRTVGARLSLALLLVVAAVLAFVYLIVTPSLENRLVDSRKAQSADVAERVVEQLPNYNQADWDQLALSFASASNTRVTIFEVISRSPLTLRSVADAGGGGIGINDDPIALRAAKNLASAQGTVERGENYAEAAEPANTKNVVLVSNSIEDSLASVELVKHRLAISALVALVAALFLGYIGARLFARRIRRLEQAAERIASGKFDEPIVDSSPDELGQLARAFDRMRERLAGLERARREFIANASHELRTPLFSLGGHLELLVDEDLDEATKQEFLERMREQVDRLTKLAGELLDLSRLDAGRLRVDREPVDLAQIVETLLEEFEARAQGTGHDLARDGVGRRRDRPRRPAAGAPGRQGARRERDPAHAGGHPCSPQHEPQRRPGRAGGRRRRTGYRPCCDPSRLRALLPRRLGRPRLRQRPRPRDRPGARGGDARRDRPLLGAGTDGLHVFATCAIGNLLSDARLTLSL